MVFKNGDKVKVKDAVSVDMLMYDMFRVTEKDDCSAYYLNTVLELMKDTLTVTVNDGAVFVSNDKCIPFYISTELLELVEEGKPELDMKVIEDYVKPLQDYIRLFDGYKDLSVLVSGHYFEVKNSLGTRIRL